MTKKQIKSSIKQEIKDYIFIIKKHQEMIHFYEGMIKAAADRNLGGDKQCQNFKMIDRKKPE